MRNTLAICAGVIALTTFARDPASAVTSTTTFNVQIVINSECQAQSATNMNFGSTGVLTAPVDATSTINVQCTQSTPYDIGLSAGNGTGATVAARLMTSGAGNTITYSLYQNNARTVVWGDTVGATVASVGTGAVQSFTVYGRVPAQTTPPAATYTDTITVTVTY